MYGKAVKCDVCERMDIVEAFDLATTFFDAGFAGWVRITVNTPRDYGWTFRDPKYADTVNSVDCCSLYCARKYLRDVEETIPKDETVASDA